MSFMRPELRFGCELFNRESEHCETGHCKSCYVAAFEALQIDSDGLPDFIPFGSMPTPKSGLCGSAQHHPFGLCKWCFKAECEEMATMLRKLPNGPMSRCDDPQNLLESCIFCYVEEEIVMAWNVLDDWLTVPHDWRCWFAEDEPIPWYPNEEGDNEEKTWKQRRWTPTPYSTGDEVW